MNAMQPTNSFTGKIIDSGRVTIPQTIREQLELKDGDLVKVRVSKIPNKRDEP